ncbi:hypothetical protein EST38_g9492 [Candolleomyces aberdarensis]|uniref:F-box domain-containing protein n=1 Tax=Candolleomyces aberdarensis TaxID=2316362 RepID=A0A4V1Q2V0_9AGAR|nr:hypothetical protein EST38_g9492 [Candolleomyces aberdarensis]
MSVQTNPRKLVQLAPLGFDRVVDGAPVTSSALLFQFPVEILSHIVENLSFSDLATLAQVDNDCRQLARSIQFVHAVFDFRRPWTCEFVEALEKEIADGSVSPVYRRHRRIACCIRRIKLYAHPHVVQGLPVDSWVSRVASLCAEAFPNLYSIEWQTPNPQPMAHRELLVKLQASTAKHIKFDAVWEPLPILPLTTTITQVKNPISWNLETLDIMYSVLSEMTGGSSTVYDLVERCGETLRTFVWRNGGPLVEVTPEILLLLLSRLPHLRHLRLENVLVRGPVQFNPPTLAQRCTITHLDLRGCDGTIYEWFEGLGTFERLRSLRVNVNPASDTAAAIRFLENNTHLIALDVGRVGASLRSTILPLLRSQFNDLVALRLAWDPEEDEPSADAFEMIAGIEKLERLWISGPGRRLGQGYGYRTDAGFSVDHALVLRSLLPFVQLRLRTLIFTGDTYTVPGQQHPLLTPQAPHSYYDTKRLPHGVAVEDYLTPEECKRACGSLTCFDFEESRREWRKLEAVAWERWHHARMREHAKAYFGGLERLKMVHVGMRPVHRDEVLDSDVENGGLGCEKHGQSQRDEDGFFVEEFWDKLVTSV